MRRLSALLAVAAVLALAAPSAPVEAGALPEAVAPLPCPAWSMYGQNPQRTFATECDSPITPANVATLIPAWYHDTERPITATPAVADGVVYVGSWEGIFYAFAADDGAVQWAFEVPEAPGATYGPIISSAALTDVTFDDGAQRRLVVFGSGGYVYALDATDGEQVWRHDATAGRVETPTEYESSPVIVDDMVLIGRDTHNEAVDLTGGVRGGLVSLDVRTGAEIWRFEPELNEPGTGCGGMWSSPTVDIELDLVFMGTANCPHEDSTWTAHTNAVTALELATGQPVWSFQPSKPPDDDTDFGATPNLFVDAGGRKVLGAGKKDGTYYALDPATGDLLWSRHVVDPAPNIGGFIGSPGVWEGRVFGGTALGTPPYFHAIDGDDGEVAWQGTAGPSYGAVAIVNGVVFTPALDDLLKAFDADTGALLWATPLSGPGSSGPAVYQDMVFIGAGTSTSDACAKDNPTDALCVFLFDRALGQLGGLHAYRLAAGGDDAPSDPPSDPGDGDGSNDDLGGTDQGAGSDLPPRDVRPGSLPATGGTARWPVVAALAGAAVVLWRLRPSTSG